MIDPVHTERRSGDADSVRAEGRSARRGGSAAGAGGGSRADVVAGGRPSARKEGAAGPAPSSDASASAARQRGGRPVSQQPPWAVLDELSTEIQLRRREAERAGDRAGAVRLGAMAAVMATKLIPIACPDAVTVAGDAALAAHEGRAEPDWFAAAYGRQGVSPEGRTQLNLAIRLLRSAGLWPWDQDGHPDRHLG